MIDEPPLLEDHRLAREIIRLRDVMRALRDPDGGCPWDLEQTFSTIAPYTIEEAYEVADAIERGNLEDLRGELGDLLLQTVYHAHLAEEDGAFDLADVTAGIADKMVARHPHVFGEERVTSAEAQTENWEAIKARERGGSGALAGVARALPALMRAQKLQKRAARVGFDWPSADGPREKIFEELGEIERAVSDAEREAEAGDLLFAAVNFIRHLGVDAEVALRAANLRFERRFAFVEGEAGGATRDRTAEELEASWARAKANGL